MPHRPTEQGPTLIGLLLLSVCSDWAAKMDDAEVHRRHRVRQSHNQVCAQSLLQVRNPRWLAVNAPTGGRVENGSHILSRGGVFSVNEKAAIGSLKSCRRRLCERLN